MPHDELVRSGILREISPEDLAVEKATTAEHVQHRLEHRPSARELVDKGIVPVWKLIGGTHALAGRFRSACASSVLRRWLLRLHTMFSTVAI